MGPARLGGVSNRALTDKDVVRRQYADDRNLRARQRLWEISRSESELDLNAWSVNLIDADDGDIVLDAGCGNGRALAVLRERNLIAVGLDLSLGMVGGANHHRVAVGDVASLPFRDRFFDAAAALMMLYHVADQEAAAAELRRVVKPGGVVVATTPSVENQAELRAFVEAVVGGGWTWSRPSAAGFHLEGGAAVLGTAFESVEIVHAPERRIFVTDPDALADYVASSGDHFGHTLPPGRTWQDVVEAVRTAAAETVATDGALTVTSKLGAFICR